MEAGRFYRLLDKCAERGYERLLIKDPTMASTSPGRKATTLDTIRAGDATVRSTAVLAALRQAVA
jgi:hypothetical protein